MTDRQIHLKIYDAFVFCWEQTGKEPRYIYLGEVEYKQLLDYCKDQMGYKELTDVARYNNMDIVEVKKTSFLKVGGD